MQLDQFLAKLDHVQGGHGQYTARCPAHDDRHNSLSISVGKDGKILIRCHAGCDTSKIMSSMGLEVKDLFDSPPKEGKPKIVATYTYPSGAQKLRYSDKHFVWRRPDGKGGWAWDRRGIPRELYVAGKIDGAIWIVEGEKDANNLCGLGYNVVSGQDGAGAGKWRPEYTEQLTGHPVVILQDNDRIGKDYAQEVAAALSNVCPELKVLDLSRVWPEIPEHGDISDMLDHFGPEKTMELVVNLISRTPDWTPPTTPKGRQAKAASEFGEDNTTFLWYPYLPIGDYTVLMADGGTGKTILCCGIAADVSTGRPLPGDEFSGPGQNVLIISAEDSGEILKKRLAKSGADLDKVYILDRTDSIGMDFSDGYSEFEATVKACKPALVIVDPWHGFLGDKIDMSRANAIRPVLQRLSSLAKTCDCAMILISHVNKRAQGENANHAATGSSDLINAARSAIRVIFDETDEDCRIMVPTKANYTAYGQSVKYRIVDGGVRWEGFCDVTRQTLELAARKRVTPLEVMQRTEEREAVSDHLVKALEEAANGSTPTRITYDEFKDKYGDFIFGGGQPKRALDAIKDKMGDNGYYLKTGLQVKRGNSKSNGFMIQRIDNTVADQLVVLDNHGRS